MAIEILQGTLNVFPDDQKVLFSLIVYTILILMYSIFIWKFYRFLASRDIIQLNLSQYNYSNHPIIEKIAAIGLYALEYLIILLIIHTTDVFPLVPVIPIILFGEKGFKL